MLFVLSTLARTVEMFFRLRGAARRSDDMIFRALWSLREIERRECAFRGVHALCISIVDVRGSRDALCARSNFLAAGRHAKAERAEGPPDEAAARRVCP